ncbi:MAG TPA: flagellar biosynthetic protein FliQ [Terriglobia bacterium]|nr:flagellar biosynthetic protein FliQ [Terriglobia bacterium]
MTPDVVVQLARDTLLTALLLATPILAVATVVSLLINIAQVMTSIQEHTVATVPRIAVVALTTFVLLPWMLRKLMSFTVQMFADFHRFLG